jgi:hypothetical protein
MTRYLTEFRFMLPTGRLGDWQTGDTCDPHRGTIGETREKKGDDREEWLDQFCRLHDIGSLRHRVRMEEMHQIPPHRRLSAFAFATIARVRTITVPAWPLSPAGMRLGF